MKRDNIFQQAYSAMTGKYGEEDLLTDQLGSYLRLEKKSVLFLVQWKRCSLMRL
jgi:hypothetical protein